VHGATDITGFGLLGHAAELARNSGVGLRIDSNALPLLPGALDFATRNIVPGGLGRNQAWLEQDGYVQYAGAIDEGRRRLLFDPQTSGGLLLALPPAAATLLTQRYAEVGQSCWRIGEVTPNSGIEVV
jgi:selenide, water dikinase